MWELMKLELRKILPIYLPAAAVLIGIVVFRGEVLVPRDAWLAWGGALLGTLIGYRLFTDAAGTRSFLFSRPYTRRRLFLVRWGVGMALIGLVFLVAGVFLVIGLRQWVQIHFCNSQWYPMVRWYELKALCLMTCAALLTFSATMLLVAKSDLEAAEIPVLRGRLWRMQSIAPILVLCLLPLYSMIFIWPGMQQYSNATSVPLGIAYLAFVMIISTLASLHAFRRLPVES